MQILYSSKKAFGKKCHCKKTKDHWKKYKEAFLKKKESEKIDEFVREKQEHRVLKVSASNSEA